MLKQTVMALSLAAAALGTAPGYAQDQDGAGEARTCVPLRQIRQTHVLDDQTIVFEMTGRRYYLNKLPNRCPRLGFEESFSYATSLSQLCNVDIITVIQNFGGRIQPGPACGLGMFEPISRDAFKALKNPEEAEEDDSR